MEKISKRKKVTLISYCLASRIRNKDILPGDELSEETSARLSSLLVMVTSTPPWSEAPRYTLPSKRWVKAQNMLLLSRYRRQICTGQQEQRFISRANLRNHHYGSF